jgi:hypothetical protein
MSQACFWSFCTSGFSRRLLFQAQKKRTTKTRCFLLLRLSYSFLILSSFLGDYFGPKNPDISHDWLRYPRSQHVSLCWEVTYPYEMRPNPDISHDAISEALFNWES